MKSTNLYVFYYFWSFSAKDKNFRNNYAMLLNSVCFPTLVYTLENNQTIRFCRKYQRFELKCDSFFDRQIYWDWKSF